ncbi:MAG: HYR domain-containing protein [Lewinellaceae bacterium]|nr:HYR domain-containing protein [Lewinellaceae bacterium]
MKCRAKRRTARSRPETITRTYYIEDDCGNFAICTQTIVVDDEVEPTLTCPAELAAICDSDEQAVYANFDAFETAGGSAADNCTIDEGSFQLLDEDSDGETCPETVTRTYQIADQCGNLATCEQRIVVNDMEAPELTCPANLTATCSITEQPAYADLAAFETAGGEADDNCGIDALSFTLFSEISDNNTCPEVITRTYRIADLCGNTAACEQTITIDDEEIPELVCPANLTATCSITEQPPYTSLAGFEAANGTADDNCGINASSFVLLSEISDDNSCPEVVTRTYQVADLCGNVSSCVQTVTIDDEIPPTALCQDITVELADITITVPAEDVNDNSTDNCNGQLTFSLSPNTFDCSNLGDNAVELTVTDACGNESVCSATITVTLENGVTELPTVALDQSASVICSGDEYTLEFGGGSNPAGTVYMVTWTIAPTFTSSMPTDENVTLGDDFGPTTGEGMVTTTDLDLTGIIDNINVNSVDITFTVTPKYGPCAGTPATITVTVRPLPQVLSIDPTPPTAICSGAEVGPFSVEHNIVAGLNNNQIMWMWSGTDITAAPDMGTDTDGSNGLIVGATTLTNTGATAQTATLTIIPKRLNANNLLCEGPAFTVEILVEPKPAIVCPDDIVATTDGGNCDTTITLTHPALNYDPVNCPGGSLEISFAAGTPAPAGLPTGGGVSPGGSDAFSFENGQTLVTYTVTDGQGNTANCTFTVDVTDNDKPVVTCPDPLTVECDDDLTPGAMAPTGIATATDNCPPVAMLTHEDENSPGPGCPQEYVIFRTWTAKDDAGNESTCIQVITVDDSTPPVISCPANTTVDCNTSTEPAETGTAGATDNCSMPTVAYDDEIVDGDCPQEFTIERTWLALDACGNQTTCVQTIFVQDIILPTISCPAAVTVECDDDLTPGDPGQGFPTGFATATDNCDPAPALTHDDSDPFIIPNGCPEDIIIQRTWTVRDACGNETSCVQAIRVQDTTAPVIDVEAEDKTVECDGSGNTTDLNDWLDNNGGAEATDACGTVTWTNDFVALSNDCGATGTVTVTFTATDECDNASVTTATFTIEDTTAPTMEVEAEDKTVECDGSGNTTDLNDWLAANGGAEASDICGDVTWSNDFVELSDGCGATGSVMVTFTAKDDCGNESVTTATFTIEDTTPPSIDTEASDLMVECDGSGNTTALADWLADNGGAEASDICGGVTWSNDFDELSDGCGATGSVTVTFTAKDDCGNESVTTATLTIKDETPPTIVTEAGDKTVECDGNGNMTELADWLAANGGAEASDDCGAVSWSNDFVALSDDCGATGSAVVTFAATDACGNTSYTTATFTIEDTTPPGLTAEAADRTVECDGAGNADDLNAWLAANGGAEAADACGSVSWSNDFAGLSDGCGATGSVTVTFTATDECDNESVTTATFTIEDTSDPELTAEAEDLIVECDGAGNTTDLANWLAANGGAEASDACSDVTWTNDFVELSDGCGETGSTTVIFTATDDCGNAVQTTATFTIEDTTFPDLVCPKDTVINCEVDPIPANTGTATVSDACDSGVMATFSDAGDPAGNCPERTITRTWMAIDACQNTTACEQIIVVQDTTKPVIVCPAHITVSCEEGTDVSVTGEATATDNCDTDPVVLSTDTRTDGDCPNEYSIARRWVAVDNCQKLAVCVQNITVQDITPPNITLCPDPITVECNTSTDPSVTGMAEATDNCSPPPVVESDDEIVPSMDCPQEFQIIRTWKATDACENTTTCVQTITVDDSKPPVITCAPNVTVECDADLTPGAGNPTGITTATDVCDTAPVVLLDDEVIISGDCPQEKTIIRTWVALDACSNGTVCVQTITVEDTTPPVLTCPADFTVECDETPDPVLTGDLEQSMIEDNCDEGPFAIDYEDNTGQGNCANGALITRTWMATDACGNTGTCIQQISVDDSEAPVITCPADATVECDESTHPDALGSASATDNCDMDPVITYEDESTQTDDGSCTDYSYTITRTWTAADACGNVSTCIQTIIVEDMTVPTITFCPESTTVECDQPTDPQTLGFAQATDNCDGNLTIGFDDESTQTDEGACTDFSYTITRTWTATDACDNATTCIQTITVQDMTDPVILCPEPTTVQCDQPTDPSATGEATATDNCDGNPTITYDDASTQTDDGSCTDFSYTITRTWTATDACGNSSNCEQPIIVVDTQAPVFTDCPPTITVECDLNASNTNTDPANTGVPTAEDNCDPDPTITSSDVEVTTGLQCPVVKQITRTWTVEDACGNSTSDCVQLIQVLDNTAPLIECPADITLDCATATDPVNTGGMAIAIDACDATPTIVWEDEQTTGPCMNDSLTVITRTWFAFDNCGNVEVCDQFIALIDETAPVFNVCPPRDTINCEVDPDPQVTGMAEVVDNCDAAPGVDYADVSEVDPDCPQGKIITRTWTAVDHCGNMTTCEQIIVVQDTTRPVLICPNDITVQCDDSTDPADTGEPLAQDNCDPNVLIANPVDMITPGACPGSFTIKRTWLAADDCDNGTLCMQTITVQDTEPPTWVTEPGDLDKTVDCDDPDALTAAQELFPVAEDNCDDDVTNIEKEEGDFVPGQCPHTGTYTNTWTVTDECGNVSEVFTQVITVQDIVAPTFTVPADATVYSDGNCEYDASTTVTGDVDDEDDNCATDLEATFSDDIADGDCAGDKIITRTWTLADGCGNVLTQTQVITVLDTLQPTFPKPADMTLTTEDGATCPEIASISLTIDQANPVATGNTAFSYTVHGINIDGPMVYSDNCSDGDDLKLFVWNIFEDWDGPADDCQRQIRVLWRVYDDCGNFRQRQQIFTIVDNSAPEFTVPADLTIYCEDNPTDLSLTGDVTDEFDNCHTGLEASYSDASTQTDDGSCTDYSYTITRTWTLDDGCGNTLVQTQTIVVEDITSPTLSCPPNITISCDASTLPDNTGMATADDNCDGDPEISYSDTDNQTNNGTCTDQAYLITRVWTAVDACGNQAQPCTQTIQLIDDEAPVITCPADATVNCSDDISPTVLGVATAMDNCDPAPGIADHIDFTLTAPTMCPEVKVIIRTWQTVDNCNNPAACTQRIAFVDLTAPEFDFCPKDTVINCDADYSIAALGGDATAIDNCGGPVSIEYLGEISEPTPCPQGQLITRSWEAEDECGNTSICKQIIEVQDTTRPTIICPGDVTVQCNESTDPDENPNMGVPTVSDNCDMDLATSYTETNLGGDDCTQTVLRNWITSDDCNIAAACIQVITITDSEAPVWTFVPASVQLECDGVAPPYEAATAEDECDADITVTYEGEVSEPGACPGSTVITRTWSTFDDCGNQTSTQQVITIQDSQPPTWTTDPLPADLTLECGETIPDPATLEAEDFCDDEISVEYAEERTDGPCPQAYTLTRSWTVEDDCGNVTTHIQVITVEDTAAPQLTCPPTDLTLECGNPENADLIAAWLASASAEDDCGDATVTNNYAVANFSDGCGETGEQVVIFFAVDACQNQSEPCTRTIRIEDNTAPVLSCPDDLILECGATANEGLIANWLATATAEDACGDATVSHNYSPTAFSDGCGETGEQTVTFQAIDECQNNAEPCTAKIVIVDSTPPVLSCPDDLTLECGDPANADLIATWLAEATAEDACGDATVKNDYDLANFSDGCGETGEQTVTFQAIDDCENESEVCTRTISIQDDTPPTLTCPQADLTLECGDPENADLIAAWLATATAEDACGDATVNNTYNPDNFSDGCGNTGEQAVVFAAVDACQNQSQPCTRTISIVDNTPPVLTCPQADLTLECGDPENDDLIAAWLDSATAEDACGDATVDHNYSPTAFSNGCGETGEQTVSFQAFDECQNSSTVCSAKIVIVDNTPPTFTVPADITLYADADCEVDYGLVGDVTDEADNCSIDLEATFEDVAEPGPGGTERTVFRTWKLTDDCGNMTVLTQTIAIRDTTPPTYVCPEDAVLAPNTDTCTHVIANQDFDPTFLADNCGIEGVGYELAGATFGSGSGSLQGVAFEVGKTTVTWTVKDVNGNATTCTAIIQVSVCATITGTIIWEGNDADTVGVAQATVTLSGDDNQAVGPTPASGDYSITPAGGSNFVITPSKPGSMTTIPIDPLNGVDDLDATLIRLHYNGFLLITDPYKLIAADVDMDNMITANDEVQIRRALIGSTTALELFAIPWRFVPDTTDTPWSLGYHPAPNPFLLPIPSTRVLTGAGSGANEQNFYGIKKGDVNATADPLLKPAPIEPLVYRVQDEQLRTGKSITVVFRAANFEDLITFQHALFADPAYLQLETVETKGSPLALNPDEHFGLSRANAGDIRTLWLDTDGHTLADGTPLFALRFKVLQGGRLLSEVLRLHAPALEPKAYSADFARTSVELEFTEAANIAIDDPASVEKQIELLQNRPNPFTHHTVIGFMLPEACTAQLRILDASGRELLRIDGDYPAGYNEETIQLRDIGAIGILYYELTTPYGKQTRTMKAVGP